MTCCCLKYLCKEVRPSRAAQGKDDCKCHRWPASLRLEMAKSAAKSISVCRDGVALFDIHLQTAQLVMLHIHMYQAHQSAAKEAGQPALTVGEPFASCTFFSSWSSMHGLALASFDLPAQVWRTGACETFGWCKPPQQDRTPAAKGWMSSHRPELNHLSCAGNA